MAGWDSGTTALPASHVFFTAAWGRRQRTIAAPRWALVLAAAAVALGLLWTAGCTVYVAGHDALLAASMRRERDLQYDYEDRIAALRRQLDKTLSQQAQLERTVGTRLDTLAAQEGALRRNAGAVASLADSVRHLVPHDSGIQKAPGGAGHDARRDLVPSERTADRLAALTSGFDEIERDQQGDLNRLQEVVAGRAMRYRTALEQTGLSLSRLMPKAEAATGGPFVPLDAAGVGSPFDRATLALHASVDEAEKLQAAASHVPFGKPLDGTPEVTSPFGARLDPFLGRPALHTGIDLRDDTGTEVRATAPGRVVSAGPVNGYGIMVEIDHGAGLTTRYAHLSASAVDAGQSIDAGAIVGRVGATGRATGPHLHYETRIDGAPVDPLRFLQAGSRLAAADAPL